MAGSVYTGSDPGLSSTLTGLAPDLAPLWLRDELSAIAEKQTVFADLADDVAMPEGEGKTSARSATSASRSRPRRSPRASRRIPRRSR